MTETAGPLAPAEPHIPLTEIAFLLGYSELSAFSRTFRQWTGMALAHYRKRHGPGPAQSM